MNFISIIPARYGSTRFPGKPLAQIGDKTMIHRVYDQVKQVIDKVVVATDDHRIFSEVTQFGGEVAMTSSCHQSGTDRCLEAALKLVAKEEMRNTVIVNIQGDEPFIQPEQIQEIVSCFSDEQVQIASLYQEINDSDTLFNPNKVKVVLNAESEAVYFSRSAIPHIKSAPKENWVKEHQYYGHIGVYAYRMDVLREIVSLPQSALELSESLEQLRWLENAYRIKMQKSSFTSHGIDTPEDLETAIKFLK